MALGESLGKNEVISYARWRMDGRKYDDQINDLGISQSSKMNLPKCDAIKMSSSIWTLLYL